MELLAGSQGTRLVAGTVGASARDVEEDAKDQAASGIAPLAVSEALAARSDALAAEGLA